MEIDLAGTAADRPQLVVASENGQTISLFYAAGTAVSSSKALRTMSFQPWGSWPPPMGAGFVLDPEGGDTYAASQSTFGEIALLLHHTDPSEGEGLFFSANIVPTLPGSQFFAPVSTAAGSSAVSLTVGYPSPPVATNQGFMGQLASWDEATADGHALRYLVGSNYDQIGASWVQHGDGDPDLACASGPMEAAGARVGDSWLFAASSGSSLIDCDSGPVGPANDLIVDQLVWGTPDEIVWDVTRPTTITGSGSIHGLRMEKATDGAWLLGQWDGEPGPDLYRLDAHGALDFSEQVSPSSSGDQVSVSGISALSGAVLSVHADSGSPDHLAMELRDDAGKIRLTGKAMAPDAIQSIATIESPAEDSAILVWTSGAHGDRMQMVRISCGEGS